MFRLENRQLHILIGLIGIASLLLFFLFCGRTIENTNDLGKLKGMTDFSEAWICTLETKSLKEPMEQELFKSQTNEKYVTSVVNLPLSLEVEKNSTILLNHKVPDFDMETLYLTFRTNHESVCVRIEGKTVYESSKKTEQVQTMHRIPIYREFRDKIINIEIKQLSHTPLVLEKIEVGTYSEMMMQAIKIHGFLFFIGSICMIISILLFVTYFFVKNDKSRKRLLLYSSVEGSLFGLLFILETELFEIISNWNYEICFVKFCILIIISMMHLFIIRLFISKKRVLFLLDIGILCFVVTYISVMVLQAFSLLNFDSAYQFLKGLFLLAVLCYTIILAIAIFDYKNKQGKVIILANGICLFFILLDLIFHILGQTIFVHFSYAILGVFIYFFVLWIAAIKNAVNVPVIQENGQDSQKEMRDAMIKQLNPNLLFLAFRTLQTLIKKGSVHSVKMIYYISVYLRSNFRVIEKPKEIILFEEELEHIIAYLQLQKLRNQNLMFSVECKEKGFRIPRCAIEPLVENAVIHGIARKKQGGNIAVRTYSRKDGYAIQIIDDGVGFDQTCLKKKSNSGILYIFELLEQVCAAQTEIISKEGKGTVITIVLPILENDLLGENQKESM